MKGILCTISLEFEKSWASSRGCPSCEIAGKMKITHFHTDHYRIPLPNVLSDSTHGDITHFGLITARVETSSGAEGIGYTYCVGDVGGTAIHALTRDDLGRCWSERSQTALSNFGSACGGTFTL